MATEFEGWAIVELMGHRKLAGYVREVTLAGASMLRLDVPSDPPVTQYYGASSLYCLTPTSEEIATRLAKASRPTPVHQYELPAPKSEGRCRNCLGSGCSDCRGSGAAADADVDEDVDEPDVDDGNYEDVEF